MLYRPNGKQQLNIKRINSFCETNHLASLTWRNSDTDYFAHVSKVFLHYKSSIM